MAHVAAEAPTRKAPGGFPLLAKASARDRAPLACFLRICAGQLRQCYNPSSVASWRWPMRRFSVFSIALASLSFLALPCRAQSGGPNFSRGGRPVRINGHIYYADTGTAASNVMVVLRNAGGMPVGQMVTRTNGSFEFWGLQKATYTLDAQTPGYRPLSQSVDVTLISSFGNVLYLKKDSQAPPPPGGPTISAHELSMPESARNAYFDGKKKLYDQKNAKDSVADFQKALKEAPKFYEAEYELGMAELSLGKPALAEKDERQAISLSEDQYALADVALGTLLLNRNQFANGEKILRRGVSLDPNSWLGQYELGRAFLSLNRVKDAEACAVQAQKLAPQAATVYRLLANVHLREKNLPALLADLNAYIQLDPVSPAGLGAIRLREQVQRSLAKTKSATAAAALPNASTPSPKP